MNLSDFEFTKEEIFLLANVQYRALQKESQVISIGHLKQIGLSDDEKQEQEHLAIERKQDWVARWQKTTWKLLYENEEKFLPYNDHEFKLALNEFIEQASKSKKEIFILECTTINAYYPLSNDEEKKSKISLNPFAKKSIEPTLDEEKYITELSNILNTPNTSVQKLKYMRKSYFSYLSDSSSQIISVFEKYAKWGGAVIGIAILAMLTPLIAGAIGGLMGLSGAAAFNAGLALLGGGSIAAGGFGITGGFAVILGGGALLGFTGGKNFSDDDIKKLSSENLIISSAKLLTIVKVLTEEKSMDFKDAYKLLQSLRQMQSSFEEKIDSSVCLTQKLNHEEFKKYKNNACLVDYSRKTILEILVDNKE